MIFDSASETTKKSIYRSGVLVFGFSKRRGIIQVLLGNCMLFGIC